MKRSIIVGLFSLFLVVPSFSQLPPAGGTGVRPYECPDVVLTEADVPAACKTPGTFAAAAACLDAMAARHPNLFPGAVIGYQQDGKAMNLYAHGGGLATNSVVSLASVSKAPVGVGFVKLVQDHYASPACSPMTANCVFPQKFDTPLRDAVAAIDRLRGTDTLTRWYDRIDYADATQQRAWKKAITIRQLILMEAGFPEIAFTGYRFCPNGVCSEEVTAYDYTCDPNNDPSCRVAWLYNQYLARRGPALLNACKPRPASGTRVFNFDTYYHGQVDAPYRLSREFERRYSFEPGLFGECVLVEGPNGASWIDGRAVRESDIGKFYLGSPLAYQPGTKYQYSQQTYYILSYLAEGVTGQRFDAYLKSALFTPLNMTDTSFVVTPGTSQYQRLADIKRVPATPARVLPDIAAPLTLETIYGTDKNWDEPREGWLNRWIEGGMYSTAADLLRFLHFLRNGKAPDGRVLLNDESLALITSYNDGLSPRTFGFGSGGATGVLSNNGYFGTVVRRDTNRCYNATVLMQMITESPEGAPHRVQLCDYQFGDIMFLRSKVMAMLDAIPTGCDPASPSEP